VFVFDGKGADGLHAFNHERINLNATKRRLPFSQIQTDRYIPEKLAIRMSDPITLSWFVPY
jgi:hypothetical protein